MEIDMRAYPEFRLQILHNGKWLMITAAWDLSALDAQIDIYKGKRQVFRVQRLVNGRYKNF
jgi:hypothetical protein